MLAKSLPQLSLQRQRNAFLGVRDKLISKLRGDIPTITVKSGTTIFRAMSTSRATYDLLGRPGINNLTAGGILSVYSGTTTKDHRWSGLNPASGGAWFGGSYWGTSHGTAAENFFYTVLDNMSPNQQFKYLINSQFSPLLVQDAKQKLSFLDGDHLPFIAAKNLDIFVGRVKGDLTVLDMNINSANFQWWSDKKSVACEAELKAMGYSTIQDFIMDPNFRDGSRLIAFLGCFDGDVSSDNIIVPAIISTTARAGDIEAIKYDSKEALNFTVVGPGGLSIRNVIDLAGVIEVRTEGKQTARVGSLECFGSAGASGVPASTGAASGGGLLDAYGSPISSSCGPSSVGSTAPVSSGTAGSSES